MSILEDMEGVAMFSIVQKSATAVVRFVLAGREDMSGAMADWKVAGSP